MVIKKGERKKRIQVVLEPSIEKELRIKLGQNGFKKGDLSKYLENLIKKDRGIGKWK